MARKRLARLYIAEDQPNRRVRTAMGDVNWDAPNFERADGSMDAGSEATSVRNDPSWSRTWSTSMIGSGTPIPEAGRDWVERLEKSAQSRRADLKKISTELQSSRKQRSVGPRFNSMFRFVRLYCSSSLFTLFCTLLSFSAHDRHNLVGQRITL
eukprot:845656-Rhodomonas_salina.3